MYTFHIEHSGLLSFFFQNWVQWPSPLGGSGKHTLPVCGPDPSIKLWGLQVAKRGLHRNPLNSGPPDSCLLVQHTRDSPWHWGYCCLPYRELVQSTACRTSAAWASSYQIVNGCSCSRKWCNFCTVPLGGGKIQVWIDWSPWNDLILLFVFNTFWTCKPKTLLATGYQ